MSNFTMGTILGKGFAQAQVHTEFIAQVLKASACAKPFPKIIVPLAKLHSLIVFGKKERQKNPLIACLLWGNDIL